jgi:FkbM family methyltransferase
LDYDLDENSIVFDVGGFKGDFASEIIKRFGCNVYIFEPSLVLYEICMDRFRDNPKVYCFNFGLSDSDGDFMLSREGDASSILREGHKSNGEKIKIRCFFDVYSELCLSRIDLMKINIEGAEYPLLNHIIESEVVEEINNIQVQFHDFVDSAVARREGIVAGLSKTHDQTWCFLFVWENWRLK